MCGAVALSIGCGVVTTLDSSAALARSPCTAPNRGILLRQQDQPRLEREFSALLVIMGSVHCESGRAALYHENHASLVMQNDFDLVSTERVFSMRAARRTASGR